jgi:hypothetical protein
MDQTKSLLDRIAKHDPNSEKFTASLKSVFSSTREDIEFILSLEGCQVQWSKMSLPQDVLMQHCNDRSDTPASEIISEAAEYMM